MKIPLRTCLVVVCLGLLAGCGARADGAGSTTSGRTFPAGQNTSTDLGWTSLWQQAALQSMKDSHSVVASKVVEDGEITRREYEQLAAALTTGAGQPHTNFMIHESNGLFTFEVVGDASNDAVQKCLSDGTGEAMALYSSWFTDPLKQGPIVTFRCLRTKGLLADLPAFDAQGFDTAVEKLLAQDDVSVHAAVEACEYNPMGRATTPT